MIGAAVLVMLAVIFIPMILDDSGDTSIAITESNIPERPEESFNSRIVPIKESDMTPVEVTSPPAEPLEEVELIDEVVEEVAASDIEPVIERTVKVEEKPASTENREQPESESKAMGTTAWVVQLGSFGSEENALGLNKKLRAKGYPSFIEPLKKTGGTVYRVRVGPELLRSEAQALQKKILDGMKLEGIVVRYP